MRNSPDNNSPPESIEQQAAAWVLRRDRGLTAAEQDAFSEWLAADPRNGTELARHRRHWKRLDQLAEWRPEHSARPNPDLLAPPLRRRLVRFAPAAVLLAAAAAVAVMWVMRQPAPAESGRGSQIAAAEPIAPSQRVLEDGTIVVLNREAALSVEFTANERRVTLDRGEAHFTVMKDSVRPFVVRVQGVEVRAIGTAFNVRVDAAAVEVLVTEGRVQLDSPRRAALASDAIDVPAPPPPILEARQRAVVSLTPEATVPQIATLTRGEIERVLAWQHRLLDFTAAPLTEVVAEFNRRNVVQLVLIDPELAAIRVSATLRSDNIAGFVRLLEAGFGARAERRGESEILLRVAR